MPFHSHSFIQSVVILSRHILFHFVLSLFTPRLFLYVGISVYLFIVPLAISCPFILVHSFKVMQYFSFIVFSFFFICHSAFLSIVVSLRYKWFHRVQKGMCSWTLKIQPHLYSLLSCLRPWVDGVHLLLAFNCLFHIAVSGITPPPTVSLFYSLRFLFYFFLVCWLHCFSLILLYYFHFCFFNYLFISLICFCLLLFCFILSLSMF